MHTASVSIPPPVRRTITAITANVLPGTVENGARTITMIAQHQLFVDKVENVWMV